MADIARHDNPTEGPIERHISRSPTEYDEPVDSDFASPEEKTNDMNLARTVSIAETLSFPHEAIFVAIVCSAQLATREYSP